MYLCILPPCLKLTSYSRTQRIYYSLTRVVPTQLATFAIGSFIRCVIDLGRMAEKVIPVVKASEEEQEEEELVDPQTELREICSQKSEAQSLWSKYQECNDRVNSRSNTTETCEEEIIDYMDVVSKCVSKDLFKRLK